jgi:transposase
VSDIELLPKSKLEPVRRLEVFTGAGRRRTWTAEQKAQILAESYESGEKVSAVARRHGLTPQQLFGWRRDARRAVTRRPQARERLSLVRQLEGRRLRRAGFRVADVAKRWTMPMSDIEDYALDDILQLAVFVVDIPAETGSWETGGGGGDARLLQDLPILNGPQPLLRASLAEIFPRGAGRGSRLSYDATEQLLACARRGAGGDRAAG